MSVISWYNFWLILHVIQGSQSKVETIRKQNSSASELRSDQVVSQPSISKWPFKKNLHTPK